MILSNFTAATTRTYSLSCASAGEYDVFIVAMERAHIRVDFNIQRQRPPDGWNFQNYTAAEALAEVAVAAAAAVAVAPAADVSTTATKLRFQYQPKRLQVLLKWEKR